MLKSILGSAFLCLCLLLVAQSVRADDVKAPSNFELLRDAAHSVAEQLVESLRSSSGKAPVALRSVGAHEGNFLVESALSAVLSEAGFQVRTRPDSTGPILEFEVVDLGISYTRVHRHAWIGGKLVQREARARLFARLIDEAEAQILWAEQKDARIIDEIHYGDLKSVQEKSGPGYLQAELPARRWNKLVEPVVVTGIVVGLIVLFFSNQDASN